LAQAIFVVLARFLMAVAESTTNCEAINYHDLSTKSAILGLADYITRICLTDPDGPQPGFQGCLTEFQELGTEGGRDVPSHAVRSIRTTDGDRMVAVELNAIGYGARHSHIICQFIILPYTPQM